MFNANLLACNHLPTLYNFSFRVSISFVYSCPSISTMVSWANKIENSKSEAGKKAFAYKIKCKGPKMVISQVVRHHA